MKKWKNKVVPFGIEDLSATDTATTMEDDLNMLGLDHWENVGSVQRNDIIYVFLKREISESPASSTMDEIRDALDHRG